MSQFAIMSARSSFVPVRTTMLTIWSPLFELARQILEGRFGDDNEMRAGNAKVMLQVSK
jgi:hypothetical protein